MHKSLLLFPFLLLSLSPTLFAQVEDPTDDQNWKWKKHVKVADELYTNSQYADAAYHYEQAHLKKPKKLQYAYKAGRSYLIIKDYESSLENFGKVKDNYKKYPLAQYYYAKAMKRNENYDQAQQLFREFAERYTGEDASRLVSDALTEVQDCELAKQLKASPNPRVRLSHLDAAVNTSATDFSPMPFGSDELLFSSTSQSFAKIFESKRGLREWESPDVPAQFAALKDEHVCNPAFSPDEKRLYFTICRSIENWGALTTICEIYVTERIGNLWSAPVRLPDLINVADVTATQPAVIHENGKEILYFASNRAGGQGGMDIWYSARDLAGDPLDFSAPRNLGAKVNTANNEITPYYSSAERMLYFSSDGHKSMGGLDIFRVSGALTEWDIPANIGTPYNSGADDYFYIQNRYGDGGFLVSNRAFAPRKNSTTHEDIFEFRLSANRQSYVIKGVVYDENSTTPLSDVDVSIYELLGDDRERVVQSATFNSGSYKFEIPSGKEYKIVADKVGYVPDTRTFSTGLAGTQTEDLYLMSADEQTVQDDVVSSNSTPTYREDKANDYVAAPPPTPVNTPTSELDEGYDKSTEATIEYVYTPSNPVEAFQLRTKAPRHPGVYYKLQLVALSNFSMDDPRFEQVKDIARLDYEVILDRGNITRALLGDYFSLEAARDALSEVSRFGFDDAFIVKYEDGERENRVRL